jgi:hypothetical protein
MSLQADSGSLPNGTRPLNNDPLLALSQLKLNESTDRLSTKIVNNRHRFGKDAFGGRPDLEAKRKVNQQANTRKTTMLPVDENDDFFSDTKKDRKPRRGNTSNGGRNAV